MPTKKGARRGTRRSSALSETELDALVEEATVDANGEEEQLMGFFSMISDNLDVPFETSVLGVPVIVEKVEIVGRIHEQVVAICKRGRRRQAIPITALPLPSPRPAGAEWIDAYRRWLGE